VIVNVECASDSFATCQIAHVLVKGRAFTRNRDNRKNILRTVKNAFCYRPKVQNFSNIKLIVYYSAHIFRLGLC